MSDKIIALQPKGHTEESKDQEPIPANTRLQWVADLVCAILNAENIIKRSSSIVKRTPDI